MSIHLWCRSPNPRFLAGRILRPLCPWISRWFWWFRWRDPCGPTWICFGWRGRNSRWQHSPIQQLSHQFCSISIDLNEHRPLVPKRSWKCWWSSTAKSCSMGTPWCTCWGEIRTHSWLAPRRPPFDSNQTTASSFPTVVTSLYQMAWTCSNPANLASPPLEPTSQIKLPIGVLIITLIIFLHSFLPLPPHCCPCSPHPHRPF